jgi:hypothetical protein
VAVVWSAIGAYGGVMFGVVFDGMKEVGDSMERHFDARGCDGDMSVVQVNLGNNRSHSHHRSCLHCYVLKLVLLVSNCWDGWMAGNGHSHQIVWCDHCNDRRVDCCCCGGDHSFRYAEEPGGRGTC